MTHVRYVNITDGQTDGQTDGRLTVAIPHRAAKSRGALCQQMIFSHSSSVSSDLLLYTVCDRKRHPYPFGLNFRSHFMSLIPRYTMKLARRASCKRDINLISRSSSSHFACKFIK